MPTRRLVSSSILLLAVIALAAFLAACAGDEPTSTPTQEPTQEVSMSSSQDDGDAMMEKDDNGNAMMEKDLPNYLIAPHFVNSSPEHGQTFMQAPELIVINFNFNLHENSDITVTRDGQPVDIGAITIDDNELTMRTTLGSASGDGVYTVQYSACWPDASCHEGQFGFIVNSETATYIDMTGEREVMIDLKNIQIVPAKVIISSGTMVTWVNDDPVEHFINSDPHPSHNVLPELNSAGMENGDTFTYTFDEPGEWSYHCSAHAEIMRGNIVVVP